MPEHDVVIVGGGPGGYVAAIRAAQLGLDAACVELEKQLGGTCLRVGCIPSKALLESSEIYERTAHHLDVHGVGVGEVTLDVAAMMRRKRRIVGTLTKGIEGLFRKNKVARYLGRGRIAGAGKVTVTDAEGTVTELTAKHIILALGSVPSTIPGIELDGDRVGTSTEALSYEEVPGTLVVIGAGVIGLELGQVWSRLGSKVIVLEYLDRILPGMDEQTASMALKSFEKQGIDFRLSSRVTSAVAKPDGSGAVVTVDGADPIDCDRVLVAVGRKPNTADAGLETVGIEVDRRGVIPVGDHLETSAPNVYSIGDCVRGPMLAHKAEEEGVACAEYIKTGYGHVNYDVIPGVVYTQPEIASVGKTEEELREAGIAYNKGAFPFMANGRARALDSTEGQVKILAHADTDRVLGVHIIGPMAGELIAEAAVSMEFGASSEDIARTCHAHPTLSEVIKEAALGVDKRSLHI